MPVFLHTSLWKLLSFVNWCASCYFLQLEAECQIYTSLTPVPENVPILTKLPTYFVRSKAVAALKAVHTSQAASHSVGSLQEKRWVTSSRLFLFFWRLNKDGNSGAGEHRAVHARDTSDVRPQIVGLELDCTSSDIFRWQNCIFSLLAPRSFKPAALLFEATEYFLIHLKLNSWVGLNSRVQSSRFQYCACTAANGCIWHTTISTEFRLYLNISDKSSPPGWK